MIEVFKDRDEDKARLIMNNYKDGLSDACEEISNSILTGTVTELNSSDATAVSLYARFLKTYRQPFSKHCHQCRQSVSPHWLPRKITPNPTMRPTSQYAAEAIGTFILVFAGTGAVVFGDITDGQVTPLGIGLVFGLVVMALIYTLGDVSGAHINPAVTIAFWAAGKFPGRQVAPYIVSQCAGATMASAVLRALFGLHKNMGATLPIEGLVYQCLILGNHPNLHPDVRDS